MGKRYDKTEAFLSLDVESDGNNPVQYSMRSIGIALFVPSRSATMSDVPIDTFYRTLQPQVNKACEDVCMQFWERHPVQWEEMVKCAVDPVVAMKDLSDWLSSHAQVYTLKWVASPANFDWMFLKCYYELYGPEQKYAIGFFCHDLNSLIRAYSVSCGQTNIVWLKDWLADGNLHTHNAKDDAIRQGVQYCAIRRLLKGNRMHGPRFHRTPLR
jgi:hypothetical protein